MSNEDYTNALMQNASVNIGRAGVAMAERIMGSSNDRHIRNVIQQWSDAVDNRDATIRRNNSLIHDMRENIDIKTTLIKSLTSLAHTWEERAVRAESAEDSWKDTIRELASENKIHNFNKEDINKRFHKFHDPRLEKNNQAMLAKRK